MDNEEYIAGNRCIGAPVLDYRGEAIAAISASGPISLLPMERVSEVAEQINECAGKISRQLCYKSSRGCSKCLGLRHIT